MKIQNTIHELNLKMKFDFLIESFLNKKTYVIIAGIHGDEPAGNKAAEFFKNQKNVYVISNINKTHKRRLNGKDLNRHFDTSDDNDLQDKILLKIEELSPSVVISLHEDDEVDGVYAYCSPELESEVSSCLNNIDLKLANSAHGDKTKNGVIVNGKQPYKGTLERALKRRNILYCTIETPSSLENIEKRIDCLKNIVHNLIN
jgi:predicted deacylase